MRTRFPNGTSSTFKTRSPHKIRLSSNRSALSCCLSTSNRSCTCARTAWQLPIASGCARLAFPMEPLEWFTAGDVDGFFGLFFSGFPDLLLIVGLAPLCGFPAEFVTRQVLPGVAISILAGNLFYAWQARRLAERSGRDDVTAIPF